uniref:Secreted protein n=1 Tax=Magallana gigas TaxID=29159 RepID=A0A8W8LK46_MAGGI
MFSNNMIVVGLFVGVFRCFMAADLTRCVFPKGLMNGHCVDCPVDTLYEYVPSYSDQIVGTGFWKKTITKDESYHRCVKDCPPKYPYISSNRKCARGCSGNNVQRAISFGIRVFYHCNKLRRGVIKNRVQPGDNGDPTEEVNLLQMEETCS